MGTVFNNHPTSFQGQRAILISLSKRLVSMLEASNITALYDEVNRFKHRLSSDSSRILVVGGAGRGKSTIEYEHIELFAPFAPCNAGIEITDLAGPYDEDGYLEVTQATLHQVFSADAVLFVLGCDSLPSKEDLLAIDRMRYVGYKAIFFLCNRFDLVEPSRQECVKQRFITRLASLTAYGEERVFFTNARSALAGCLNDNSRQFRQSNMPPVEDALYHFLAYEHGQEKLALSAARLAQLVQSTRQVVSIQRRLLDKEQQELQARCTKALQRLEQLDTLRQHHLTLFSLVRRSLQVKTSAVAANFIFDIADMIESEPQAYFPQQPDSPWDAFTGNIQQQQVKDLTVFLTEAVQNEFEIWIRSTLQPIIQERVSWLGRELHEYSHQFASDLKQIKFELSGEETEIEAPGENTWEKITRKMVLDAPMRIASIVIKQTGFIWHSSAIIASFLKLDSIRRLLLDGACFEKIKAVVGEEYRYELLASFQKRVDTIVAVIDYELSTIQEELGHALHLEAQIIRDVVHEYMGETQPEQECKQPVSIARQRLEGGDKLSSLTSELDSLRAFLKWHRFGLSP